MHLYIGTQSDGEIRYLSGADCSQARWEAFQIILLHGEPIGRLYVARWEQEIRIVDLALLPEHRDRGIGSQILKDLLAEGKQQKLPVRIHVEQYNPALRLYHRMGFQKIGEHGVYWLMEARLGD